MLISIGELRELVLEAFLENIPSMITVEKQIESAGNDKAAISRVLSVLLRKFPPASKLLIQSLGRTIVAWQSGKGSYNDVVAMLEKLYASVDRKKTSYSRGSSLNNVA